MHWVFYTSYYPEIGVSQGISQWPSCASCSSHISPEEARSQIMGVNLGLTCWGEAMPFLSFPTVLSEKPGYSLPTSVCKALYTTQQLPNGGPLPLSLPRAELNTGRAFLFFESMSGYCPQFLWCQLRKGFADTYGKRYPCQATKEHCFPQGPSPFSRGFQTW